MPISPANATRGPVPIPAIDRVMRKIAVVGECWEFCGALRNGYGVIGVNRRIEYAHRASYIHHHGAIPDGFDVCHSCDNRRCVRPEHLFAGTRSENLKDAGAKGRLWQQLYPERIRGSKNTASKLNEDQVSEIRKLIASGERQLIISRRYGVCRSTISHIATGRKWCYAD